MIHIRQKNSSVIYGQSYIVVKTTDWTLPLEEHPSIVDHPEYFEIADCEIPRDFTYLIYKNETN